MRANFFDTQIFGEHGWEILLHRFALDSGVASIEQIAEAGQARVSEYFELLRDRRLAA